MKVNASRPDLSLVGVSSHALRVKLSQIFPHFTTVFSQENVLIYKTS